MKNKNNGLMIEGNILKQLLLFSIPLILGNLFQQLYNTIDSIVVGNYIGDSALAAVNSSGAIIDLIVSFFMGLSVGAGVVISNHYGAQNNQSVEDSVHTAMALTIVCGIITTLIGVLFTPYILNLVHVAPEVMDNSVLYLKLYFSGIIGLVTYNMGSGILRAIGDSKTPLYFLIISSITNIILDILFVSQFKMGIAGVAYATIIAQFLSATLVIIKLMKANASYKLHLKKIRFHKEFLYRMIQIGIPGAIQNAIVSVSNVVVQANINSFGKYAMAGAGSYMKIDGFAILPVMSFSMALTTFTGQNAGASKFDRVKKGAKIGILLSLCTTLIISIILLLFAPEILTIFSKNSEVIRYGKLMMNCVLPGYMLLAISQCIAGVLRGVGLTKVPMFIMVLCWCICRIIWIIVMVHLFNNISFVFLGWPITWLLSTVLFVIYYRKVNWLAHYQEI